MFEEVGDGVPYCLRRVVRREFVLSKVKRKSWIALFHAAVGIFHVFVAKKRAFNLLYEVVQSTGARNLALLSLPLVFHHVRRKFSYKWYRKIAIRGIGFLHW